MALTYNHMVLEGHALAFIYFKSFLVSPWNKSSGDRMLDTDLSRLQDLAEGGRSTELRRIETSGTPQKKLSLKA